jgi:hypothetical protein
MVYLKNQIHRRRQVGNVLGLNARNVIAWAGASPTSGGPGTWPKPPKVCKTDTTLKGEGTACPRPKIFRPLHKFGAGARLAAGCVNPGTTGPGSPR